MGNIVLLDDLTINQMAAGEVVEKPANAVKELVENSIDAGATKIIVEIKNGGKTLIKITDNGKGMAPDDMELSIERHATSKLRTVDDLEKIYTMGFRGEALASIASISRLTIVSKTDEQVTGMKFVVEGGEIVSTEEVVCQTGTTIIVENLFFNTPVRYKFLKQDFTEFRYIKELIQKIALSNPDVSIVLFGDGKKVFSSNGSGRIKDIIYSIYGREIQENIIDVNHTEGDIQITGVIGNTRIARDTRKDQIVFLNNRNIKNAVITNSADQAFKGSTGIGKYGFFILNIKMPANMYDVNVHPTKTEVRFKNEDEIYRIVYRAIKNSLLNEIFLGNEDKSDKAKYISNEYNFLTNHFEKEENFIPGNSNEELIKRDEKRKVEYKFIGISFRTYIIIEIENEVYLIDQHAAHERILYEQIKSNYKNNISTNTQMMLIAEVIDLSHKEADFIKNNMEMFTKVGYDMEFFGENTIKISGIPDIEYKSKTNVRDMFFGILDEMITNSRSNIKDIEERFIATVACKAAVKAHMNLTKEEVDYLIQNLLTLQNPYTCPHGRPTTIKFNKNDFEKKIL